MPLRAIFISLTFEIVNLASSVLRAVFLYLNFIGFFATLRDKSLVNLNSRPDCAANTFDERSDPPAGRGRLHSRQTPHNMPGLHRYRGGYIDYNYIDFNAFSKNKMAEIYSSAPWITSACNPQGMRPLFGIRSASTRKY